MEGRVRAALRKREDDIALAYHIMLIDRDNQKGMMKPLSKYLKAVRPEETQTGEDVFNIFMSLKAKGKSVKIREVKR